MSQTRPSEFIPTGQRSMVPKDIVCPCGLEKTTLSASLSWVCVYKQNPHWVCPQCQTENGNKCKSHQTSTDLYFTGPLWKEKYGTHVWPSPVTGYVYNTTAYADHMLLYPDIYTQRLESICRHYKYDQKYVLHKDKLYGVTFLIQPTIIFSDPDTKLICVFTFTWDGYVDAMECILFAPEREMDICVVVETLYIKDIIHHTYSWTNSTRMQCSGTKITGGAHNGDGHCFTKTHEAHIEITDTFWIRFKINCRHLDENGCNGMSISTDQKMETTKMPETPICAQGIEAN